MKTVWLLFVSLKLLNLTSVEVKCKKSVKMCSFNILRHHRPPSEPQTEAGHACHRWLFCVQYLIVCELCEKRENLCTDDMIGLSCYTVVLQ